MHDKCLESEQYLALLKNTNTVPALWPLSHDKVLAWSKYWHGQSTLAWSKYSGMVKVLWHGQSTGLGKGLYNIRAVASGGQRGNCLPPKPANNFLERPNLRARLRADLFLSGFSKVKSQEMHF